MAIRGRSLFAILLIVCVMPVLGGPNRWTEGGPPRTACRPGVVNCSEITSIALDPFDDSVLYVTMLSGLYGQYGLWRTGDGGATWSRIRFPNDDDPSAQAQAISVSKTNSNTLYLLTRTALYRSADAGNSWSASTIVNYYWSTALVVDAVNDKTLFVSRENFCLFGSCVGGGVQRSDDSGKSWRSMGLDKKTVSAIFEDPSDRSALYAIVEGRIFQTTNRGSSWKDVTPSGAPEASMVAVDPLNRSTLYAMTGTYFNPHLGIFKSFDRGASWRLLEDEQFEDGGQNVIAVDPFAGAHLVASTGHGKVLQSTDGGDSWSPLTALDHPMTPLQIVIGRTGKTFHAAFSNGYLLHYSIVQPRRRAVGGR
jgi:photosystem II stability/assembly factor-like uncharacterized protein